MTLSAVRRAVGWVLLLLMAAVFQCTSNSPPGKPVLTHCQSPEKETFTCWWEPGPDEGEDTTYRLFYEKETKGTFECPDYRMAGKNSCFFDKNHTSIWIDYFLTVVAFNAFGNTTSDVYKIDVMDIVKPNPPENVTLWLELSEEIATVHVAWNHYSTGTKFGWITPKYQLRFKKENTEWSIKDTGIQTQFSLYSATPGTMYMVQVRCALDNGAWSEWSNTTYIIVPKSEPKQHQLWILVSVLLTIPLLAALCILFIKWKFIKQWLLPPVPGPKIKGVDMLLLKNGRSEEVTSSLLINHVFPPMMPWKNLIEEYLIVCDDNLVLVEGQKSSNGMIISNSFHCEPNINRMTEESNVQNNLENREEEKIMDYLVHTSESGLINELNHVNAMEAEKALFNPKDNGLNAIKPVENSSYVDIQRQEVTQEVAVNHMDYSTVKEINGDNILILEKQNNLSKSKYIDINRQEEESLPDDYTRVKEVNSDNVVLLQDPSCRNKGLHTDCGNQKPSNSVNGKMGIYTDFLANGYVDNIPTPPIM